MSARGHRLVLLACLAGCGRLGFDETAASGAPGADANAATPVARVVSQAYWTNWFDMPNPIGTPGTSFTGYSLPTQGVADGELLLIVACVDNGSDTVWPDPLGPGFTQIEQRRWGNDGQSCSVNWKIASSEPAAYTGTYGPGIVSASALLVLLAVSGADTIDDHMFTYGAGTGTNPVSATSPGVTTSAPDSLVVYATGSDWECFEVTSVAFTVPAGFTQLFVSTDRGGIANRKDWTAFQIATRPMSVPGATGAITSSETSDGSPQCLATPWTAAIVIPPR